MTRVRPGRLGHGGPNMTPMVDVVMCILIFFMLGSSFALPELYLSNTTPVERGPGLEPVKPDAIPPVRIPIALRHARGVTWASAFNAPATADLVTLSANPASTASLPDLLRERRGHISDTAILIITPQSQVPYQDVIAAYDACIKAKYAHVTFTLPR